MTPTKTPQTISDIQASLEEAARHCHDLCSSVPADKYNQQLDGKWSVAQNLDHLIKSTKALAKGLGMPSMVLRQFGKPNRPGRSYEEVVQRYQEKLKVANPEVNPFGAKDDVVFEQAKQLEEWDRATASLLKVVEKKWSDEEKLDKYLLPHPLLGRMLVREMLFFTVYHSWHHCKAIQKLIDNL